MNKPKFNRSILEINLNHISHNIKAFKKKAKNSSIMAVVKANAYGLFQIENFSDYTISKKTNSSSQPLIEFFLKHGIKNFGISCVDEAIQLRKLIPSSKGEIHLLGNWFKENIEDFINLEVTLPINSFEQFTYLKKISEKLEKKINLHILIDTGMGRCGIPYFKSREILSAIINQPSFIKITGIFSHLSNANKVNDPYTLKQIERFDKIVKFSKTISSQKLIYHLANSWGAGNYPQSHYDMVRIGIGLYGVLEDPPPSLSLLPAISLKSYLIEKRKLPKGSTISYNKNFSLPEEMWVGTVAIGYGDGIPIGLGMPKKTSSSNLTKSKIKRVLINGKKIPVLGKITMDYFMVDLSKLPNAKIGDTVTIFGKDREETISLVEFATYKGSHSYDIICSIGKRVLRVYKYKSSNNLNS